LINYHITRVALDRSRVLPRFVHWTIWASGEVEQNLDATVRGATRQGVNSRIVGGLPCRIPDVLLQRRVVEHLDALERRVTRLKQARGSAELDALMPAILDRAFSGDL
jgi:type I restriction enzyme S subunit